MDTEIDLRQYFRILWRGWFYIVGFAVVFALVTFILTEFVLPKYYTAQALIYLSPPVFQVNLDSSVSTTLPTSQVLASLNEIALSDSVVSQLIDTLRPTLTDRASSLTVSGFQKSVLSTQVIDTTILGLSVRWPDPQESTQIAAAWVKIFTQNANTLLGYQDPQRVSALEAERDSAQASYQTAQQALITFQTQTPISILQAQRDSLRDSYSQSLAQSNRIDLLLLNVATLRTIFSAQQASTIVSAGDALSLASLQLNMLSLSGSGNASAPPLQTSGSLSAGLTYGDLLQQLDAYETALKAQQAALQARLAPLNSQLETAEGDLQKANNQLALLQSESDHTLSTYQTLLNAVNSLQVLSDTTGQVVKVGSEPVTPDSPSEPRVSIATVVAFAAGLAVGVVVVFLNAYLRQPEMVDQHQPVPVPGREGGT